ncbi:MAG: hypothetical protein LBD51_10030, partial [Bifidobacteriaceae bacterium]|nr:hypothetical protein [Bifidobacteriaceae bacterium]
MFADSHLEGSNYTEPEIKALIDGDQPPGGRDPFETAEAEGLATAANLLVETAGHGPVDITRRISDQFNTVLTAHEVIEPGVLRGEGRVG